MLALVGLVAGAGVVSADMKGKDVVYAWDITAARYQNSNVIINFDGSYVPFWHELYFDKDLWADACGTGTSTKWAGRMYYGVYHEDNAPPLGVGFQATRNWELVGWTGVLPQTGSLTIQT